MKRFPFFVCLAFLLLLVLTGIVSADSAATTTPEKTGGSIYFDSYPTGATIWLDNIKLGTTQFTYYSEKSGTFDVLVRKKGYEDYPGQVTVSGGNRVDFYARLIPLSNTINDVNTPTAPVTTATTIRKSTLNVPTSWPTPTPASPSDAALVIGAVTAAIGFFVIRRR